MNRKIYSTIFYSKNLLFNPLLIKNIRAAWYNQFVSEDELIKIQKDKIKKLLFHAYNNCPYYKKSFDDAGFHPEQFKEINDIERIPILTKRDIKENIDRLRVNFLSYRNEEVYTSGTTGIPLRFYRDTGSKFWMTALFVRTVKNFGCSIGSKTAWIWGLPKEYESLDFRKNNFKSHFIKNTTWFNAFDMNNESMYAFADFSFKFKPELVIGYVSSIFEYAKFIDKNNLNFYPPKAIWLTAEPIEKEQRDFIEKVFKSNVYSQYGSSEILHIGYECNSHKGLHVHADSRLVEITDDKGKNLAPGELGYVVITDFENYVMPIIRYKNDDISSYSEFKCNCGIKFPLLDFVKGRIYNVFKLKNGKQIYGHMFSRKLFNYVKEIQQFQIHQKTFDNIDVLIVPGDIKNKEVLINELLNYFKYYTGDEVSYNFKFVDYIERERSGKLLYTKSDIV